MTPKQTTTPTPKRTLLTTDQVAEILKKSNGTIENWRYQDPPYGPPVIKIGSTCFYEETAFWAWVSAQETTSPRQVPA